MSDLMRGLSIHHMRFHARALQPIQFGDQPGTAVRGALYQALSEHFCSEPDTPLTGDHQQRCPVCWLLRMEDRLYERGENIPRALTIQPPRTQHVEKGASFTFGLTLIGQARDMIIYLIRAAKTMGANGIGKGRGRFELTGVSEASPLLDASRPLLDKNTIRQPTLFVNPERVAEAATLLQEDAITLEFLTPLRLTANKKLLKEPDPVVFMQRLIERCQALVTYYADVPEPPPSQEWRDLSQQLMTGAQQLTIAYDDTRWVESWSGSRRQQRYTPISGLVGVTRWEGDLRPLLPWILWGQSLHVGKNAVKGNGWYRIVR